MTQYDAGPGDWSDREWESPEHKPAPHARRRGPSLPPWALLAILVGVLILLCVALVLGLKALQNKSKARTTPQPTVTRRVALPTWTTAPGQAGPTLTPSATVVLPSLTTTPLPAGQIAIGATVVVQGTTTLGLNLRTEPSTAAALVVNVKEGTELVVTDGPREGNGYTWWKLRTPDGKEGWGAADWLVLKP